MTTLDTLGGDVSALGVELQELERRVASVDTRISQAEGRLSAVEANQRAANTIQEHFVSQLSTLSDRMDAGHTVLQKHVQDEQAHWAYVVETNKQQGHKDTLAIVGVYITLVLGVLGVVVGLLKG